MFTLLNFSETVFIPHMPLESFNHFWLARCIVSFLSPRLSNVSNEDLVSFGQSAAIDISTVLRVSHTFVAFCESAYGLMHSPWSAVHGQAHGLLIVSLSFAAFSTMGGPRHAYGHAQNVHHGHPAPTRAASPWAAHHGCNRILSRLVGSGVHQNSSLVRLYI